MADRTVQVVSGRIRGDVTELAGKVQESQKALEVTVGHSIANFKKIVES